MNYEVFLGGIELHGEPMLKNILTVYILYFDYSYSVPPYNAKAWGHAYSQGGSV